MARVLPGPYRNFKNRPHQATKIVCQSYLPDGDLRKYMIPRVSVKDISVLISKVCPKLDITQGVGAHNVGKAMNQFNDQRQHSTSPSSKSNGVSTDSVETHYEDKHGTQLIFLSERVPKNHTKIVSPQTTISSYNSSKFADTYVSGSREKSSHLPNHASGMYSMDPRYKSKQSSHFNELRTSGSKSATHFSQPRNTDSYSSNDEDFDLQTKGFRGFPVEDVKPSPMNHWKCFESSKSRIVHSSKLVGMKRHGFLGFPEEDSKRLKKTRFHVNTNILASSLDLLDLHKNAGMRSGSPLECNACGITFSSVKHCKYHQSVCSSVISKDPSRCHNVKGDGVWLCPWCPVVCLTPEYLNKHKLNCRERGRCLHDNKVSSQRKPIMHCSRRRNTLPSSVPAKNGIVLNRSNSFKVVHGQVIPT